MHSIVVLSRPAAPKHAPACKVSNAYCSLPQSLRPHRPCLVSCTFQGGSTKRVEPRQPSLPLCYLPASSSHSHCSYQASGAEAALQFTTVWMCRPGCTTPRSCIQLLPCTARSTQRSYLPACSAAPATKQSASELACLAAWLHACSPMLQVKTCRACNVRCSKPDQGMHGRAPGWALAGHKAAAAGRSFQSCCALNLHPGHNWAGITWFGTGWAWSHCCRLWPCCFWNLHPGQNRAESTWLGTGWAWSHCCKSKPGYSCSVANFCRGRPSPASSCTALASLHHDTSRALCCICVLSSGACGPPEACISGPSSCFRVLAKPYKSEAPCSSRVCHSAAAPGPQRASAMEPARLRNVVQVAEPRVGCHDHQQPVLTALSHARRLQ